MRRIEWHPCRIAGCTSKYVTAKSRALHEAKQHERCACGWVGVLHVGHIAQRRRRGFDVSVCTTGMVVG